MLLGTGFAVMLAPDLVVARQLPTQTCNALVTIADNLYLVDSTGKVLTQFTSESTPKVAVAISPDGRKVAYVTPDLSAQTYEVVNTFKQQGSYPIYKMPKRDDPYGFVARSPFSSLSWSSDNILALISTAGKNHDYYSFHFIPEDLRPFSPLVVMPAAADDCVLQSDSRRLVCIDTSGSILLGGGDVDGRSTYSVTGFEGLKPEESFTLGVGESSNTQGTSPGYTVTLIRVSRDGITLRISPLDGGWEQITLKDGDYAANPGSVDSVPYGFFVKVVNAKSRLVRVDVVRRDSPWNVFDPALTWTPDGRGLVLIRRTDTLAFLYLIRPGRGEHRKDARDEGRDQWTLAAQAVIDAPEEIESMRFATPSLLLLKDDLGNYSEVPIEIGQRRGRATLTLGTVTALPSTMNVNHDGTTTQGMVLDWSCQQPRNRGIGGNWPIR